MAGDGSLSMSQFQAAIREFTEFYKGQTAPPPGRLGPHQVCAGWRFKQVDGFPELSYLEKNFVRQRGRGIVDEDDLGDLGIDAEEQVDIAASSALHTSIDSIQVTLWVCYSKAYRCPALFFIATDSSGSSPDISELVRATNIFRSFNSTNRYPFNSLVEHEKKSDEEVGMPFITLNEHPVTGRLCFSIHPCETSNLMQEILQDSGGENGLDGRQWVEAWFSVVDSVIDLKT